MFTTDSGYGWQASPEPIGIASMGGREVTLTGRGLANLAARIDEGQPSDDAIKAVIYDDRDFGHDVLGWWSWESPASWRNMGRVQICRTVEYGEVRYTATSVICDHTSKTLDHLLARLDCMPSKPAKAANAGRTKVRARTKPKARACGVGSDGEVWARRSEEGWGPGGY